MPIKNMTSELEMAKSKTPKQKVQEGTSMSTLNTCSIGFNCLFVLYEAYIKARWFSNMASEFILAADALSQYD